MAVISVRNLGQVRIAGDTPTPEEEAKIKALIKKKQKEAEEPSPFPEITDYMDVPEGNARTEAIEEYLASPQFRRLALEILGGVAGAATGGTFFAARAALRPALGLLYRSLGAGIGEGAAAGAAQTFDPRDDLAKEILRGFATGATAESIGAAIPALIKKIGFKGIKYTDDAEKAEQTLKRVDANNRSLKDGTSKVDDVKENIITPGIGSDNRFVDILENITEKSLFAGGKIVKARKGAETALTNELNILIDNLSNSATREDAGDLAIKAVQNSLDYFKSIAKKKYDKLSKASKNVNVDVTSSKKLAQELLDDIQYTRKLSPESVAVLETVRNLPSKVSFSIANNVRSELLSITRASTELMKGKAQKTAVDLVKGITKNINDTVDDVALTGNFKLRELYDSAQRFYRGGAKKFNDKALRRLTEKAPEDVYQALVRPRRPATIKALMRSLKGTKDKELRDELVSSIKGTIIGDIIGNSNRLKKKIDADYILKEFNKFGDEVLLEVFTKQELKNMRGLLDALSVAQRKTVGENVPGAIFIQLGQAGAAFGLFSGVLTAPSAAMLFGLAVVGKLFTNPKFIKFIKRGFQLDPGSPEAYTNAAQLIGAMISNNLISRDEGEDYLEDLKSSMPKNEEIRKKESSQIDKPFILSDDIGLEEGQQLTQMPTQPTRATMATQPTDTPPINPSLMATRPTGIMTQATGTMNQGLTPTEQALLSPEEQAIRLRSRGLA